MCASQPGRQLELCVLFQGKKKGNCSLTHFRNAAAWCPDIIAPTQSDSWRQANLPGTAGEGIEGEDMGGGVGPCKVECVAITGTVTRHYDSIHGVRIEWGFLVSCIPMSPDSLKLFVFGA